ncbi:MAG: hypothetical protein HY815_16245 [Candidatus Riflebacteria bacterium]|nr:hypothetical protein [Candidatus Riflebacteria bacterium]
MDKTDGGRGNRLVGKRLLVVALLGAFQLGLGCGAGGGCGGAGGAGDAATGAVDGVADPASLTDGIGMGVDAVASEGADGIMDDALAEGGANASVTALTDSGFLGGGTEGVGPAAAGVAGSLDGPDPKTVIHGALPEQPIPRVKPAPSLGGGPRPSTTVLRGGVEESRILGPGQRVQEVKNVMGSNARGRDKLHNLNAWGVPIAPLTARDNVSQYDPTKGKGLVTLGFQPEEGSGDRAMTGIHEAVHAGYHHTGADLDVTKVSRPQYIRSRINEEVDGTVQAIQWRMNMERAGKPVDARRPFPLEDVYRKSYNDTVRELRKKSPGLTAAQLDTAGRHAGTEAVRVGFTGTGGAAPGVTAGDSGQTYSDYYGSDYDRRRKAAEDKAKNKRR